MYHSKVSSENRNLKKYKRLRIVSITPQKELNRVSTLQKAAQSRQCKNCRVKSHDHGASVIIHCTIKRPEAVNLSSNSAFALQQIKPYHCSSFHFLGGGTSVSSTVVLSPTSLTFSNCLTVPLVSTLHALDTGGRKDHSRNGLL